jgi:polysaccharide pyruvyl transferase WcaK-like protein
MNKIRLGLLTANLNNGNMGCNALSYSAISLLEQVSKEQTVTFEYVLFGASSWVPELYPEFAEIPVQSCVPVSGAKDIIKAILKRRIGDIRKYEKAMASCDCFFEIAGGDSFSDIYGIRRPRDFNRGHRKVKKMRKPLVFLPQTLGPFKSAEAKRIAENSLRGAQHIFARDPISYKLAEKLIGSKRLSQAIDMAFFMDYQPREKSVGKPRIGINPSGLLWGGGYTGNNQFGLKGDYQDIIRSLIESIDPKVYDVVLVPHVLHGPVFHVEDDYKVCRQLKEEYPRSSIAPFFYTPVEAKSFISGLDLLIGSRMHCCIAAYSSGIPVYPLAYSRKFRGLFQEELGYPHGAELVSDDVEAIVAGLKHVLENLERIQSEMPDRLAKVAAYKESLIQTLSDLFLTLNI